MIRHNPEHPYYPARRNSMQQLQQPFQGHRVVSMSQFEGAPPQQHTHHNSGQPRITFSTALSPKSDREQPSMQPPVFRDLRTRYTNSPSSLKTERLPPKQEIPHQESALVRSREEIRRE